MPQEAEPTEKKEPKVLFDEEEQMIYFGYPITNIPRVSPKGFLWLIEANSDTVTDAKGDKTRVTKPRYHDLPNLPQFRIMEFNAIALIPLEKKG